MHTKFNFEHMLLDALVSTLMDQTMPIKPFSFKGNSEITFFISLIHLQKEIGENISRTTNF